MFEITEKQLLRFVSSILEQQKTEEPEPLEETEDTESIQASKEEPPVKVKKPRTEKQIEAFRLMKEKSNEANTQRKLLRDVEDKIQKEAKEEKIVKTAITIRRKQVKRQAVLDDISDEDDTPMPPKKRVSIQAPPPKIPEFIFV